MLPALVFERNNGRLDSNVRVGNSLGHLLVAWSCSFCRQTKASAGIVKRLTMTSTSSCVHMAGYTLSAAPLCPSACSRSPLRSLIRMSKARWFTWSLYALIGKLKLTIRFPCLGYPDLNRCSVHYLVHDCCSLLVLLPLQSYGGQL